MESLEKLANEGWKVRESNFSPSIYFSYPLQTQAISVTGANCKLNCGHCGGHYLKHMKDIAHISDGDELRARSFLISGGCTAEGKVPIGEHIKQLTALKEGRKLNLHVGLVNEEDIDGIIQIADKISFDFVGDDETIREVFGLERKVQDYVDSYVKLRDRCQVIPHICIGLHGGQIRGEYHALELLQDIGVEGLTFIVFTPTRETRYAAHLPPGIKEVLDILVTARKRFPKVPIHLGCMRPGGSYRRELDPWAVRGGVNSIVNPASDAVHVATSLGLLPVKREECCVL
jgi:uncharacterized radical SAM superfamily protein